VCLVCFVIKLGMVRTASRRFIYSGSSPSSTWFLPPSPATKCRFGELIDLHCPGEGDAGAGGILRAGAGGKVSGASAATVRLEIHIRLHALVGGDSRVLIFCGSIGLTAKLQPWLTNWFITSALLKMKMTRKSGCRPDAVAQRGDAHIGVLPSGCSPPPRSRWRWRAGVS